MRIIQFFPRRKPQHRDNDITGNAFWFSAAAFTVLHQPVLASSAMYCRRTPSSEAHDSDNVFCEI